MKIENRLFEECACLGWNASITYQSMNDYSVEIYTGYKSSYKEIFYTDGHLTSQTAVHEALKFIKKHLLKIKLEVV